MITTDAPPSDTPVRRTRPPWWAVAAFAVVAALAMVGAGALARHNHAAPPATTGGARVSGLPASVPTSLAELMQLGSLPATLAPEFSLRDQSGEVTTLAGLRGKVVVLSFMDPNCVDICPIVSQELLAAERDLGAKATDVEFVGVNVNPYHLDTRSVTAFTDAHGLSRLTTWRFVTGELASLQQVWSAYHISVRASGPTADVQHTSALYFIDRTGRLRYIAVPEVDHLSNGTAYLPAGPTASWGLGIAEVAKSLL